MKAMTVIYHRADYDGQFCYQIAKRYYGDIPEYIGWDYGDPEPEVPIDHDLLIMDLAVPGLMDHPKLVWIDHHKSAIEKYSSDIPGLRIDGVAACRLAWQWFYGDRLLHKADYIERRVIEPRSVRLAGEYDVWDKRDPAAEIFQYGLRVANMDGLQWKAMFDDTTSAVHWCLESGHICQQYQQKIDAEIVKHRSYDLEWEGLTFIALNTARCNSLTFTTAVREKHDACLGFYWNGQRWTVSLYGVPHKPDVDLSMIAVEHGGGGHRQACGFTCDTLPFAPGDQVVELDLW